MKALLFFAAVLVLVWSQCSANVELADSESTIITAAAGSNQLDLKPGSNYASYIYTLSKPQSSAPRLALALVNFDATPITGFSFSFEAGQTNQNQAQVILYTPWNVTTWRSLKISFLATSRSDIEVGVSSFPNLTSGQQQIFLKFQKPVQDVSSSIARPFLAGVTLANTSRVISVQVGTLGFNATGMMVVYRSDSNLTALTVSYITFNYKLAGFASYGGTIDEPILPNTTYRSVDGSLSVLENYIYGISGFAMGAAGGVSLEAVIDKTFVLNIGVGQISSNFSFSYIIFGLSPKFTCSNCNYKLPDQFGGCLSSCSVDQALKRYSDGSDGCVVCSPKLNTVVSPDGKSCVCKPGAVAVRGTCTVVDPISNNISSVGPSVATSGSGSLIITTTTTTESTQTSQNNQNVQSSQNVQYNQNTNQNTQYNQNTQSTSGQSGSGPVTPTFGGSSTNGGRPLTVSPIYSSGQSQQNLPLTVAPISQGSASAFSVVSSGQQTVSASSFSNPSSQPLTVAPINNAPSSSSTPPLISYSSSQQQVSGGFAGSSSNQPLTVAPISGGFGGSSPSQPQTTAPISGGFGGSSSNQPLTVAPISGGSSGSSSSQPLTTAPIQPASGQSSVGTSFQGSVFQTGAQVSPSQCAAIPNTYFNGASCACLPSFTNISGQCISTTQASTAATTAPIFPTATATVSTGGSVTQCAAGMYFNGVSCVAFGTGAGAVAVAPSTIPGGSVGIATTYPAYPSSPVSVYPATPAYPATPGYPVTPGYPSPAGDGSAVCPATRMAVQGVCMCQYGLYLDLSGQCLPANNNCCGNNNNNNGGNKPRQDCGKNGFWNARRKKCVCREGFYWTGNGCASGVECPENSRRVNATNCTCNAGYVMVSDTCAKCYQSGIWDGSKCVYSCEANAHFDSNQKRCVCNDGYKRTGSKVCESCGANQFSENQTCKGCPIYSYLDSKNTTSCTCEYGFSSVPQGSGTICKNNCPSGSRLDSFRQVCKCIEDNNYIFNNTECRPCGENSISDGVTCTLCPLNSQVDGTTCVCRSADQVYDPINNLCAKCPRGQFVKYGVCASCPINSTYDASQGRCICQNGYTRRGGLCILACPDGILESAGICGYCPPNSVPNTQTKSCDCRDGYQKYKNDICIKRCDKGQFVSKYQMCMTCPINEVFNSDEECICTGDFARTSNGTCLPKCGYFQNIVNMSKCVCKTGYFQDVVDASKCNPCPLACPSCSSTSNCSSCINGFNLTINPSNGVGTCSRTNSSACYLNQYSAAGTCTNCRNFCTRCQNGTSCDQCADGFEWNAASLECTEICGDSRRIISQCDDGNRVSGDGCSWSCQREDGWLCFGGSPSTKDTCVRAPQGSATSSSTTMISSSSGTGSSTTFIGGRSAWVPPPSTTTTTTTNINQVVNWGAQNSGSFATVNRQIQSNGASTGSSGLNLRALGQVRSLRTGAQFMVTLTPAVTFYASQSGGNIAQQAQTSKDMVKISVNDANVRVTGAECSQNSQNLAFLVCSINATASSQYTAQLTATDPVSKATTTLTINIPAPAF